MNAAGKQDVSLAEQLGIRPNELKSSADRINFILKVQREKDFTFKNMNSIYEEWERLAERLKKGRNMLDTEPKGDRLEEIYSLYLFLHKQLGVYDEFFRRNLAGHEYHRMQDKILQILDE